MAKVERRDIKVGSFRGTAMCVASGVIQHQHGGTTTTPEFKAEAFNNHINRLEQHQALQLLDILKCSA
eukprot:212825-Amphidinium_carterae.1